MHYAKQTYCSVSMQFSYLQLYRALSLIHSALNELTDKTLRKLQCTKHLSKLIVQFQCILVAYNSTEHDLKFSQQINFTVRSQLAVTD